LNDLVSYNEKHNEANGETNIDGDNSNHSYNYGVEGPTRRVGVELVRMRQMKNMLASLLLSQGVPMILAGDECRRTQNGNNNAYCQDNEISWFDWKLVEKNEGLVRFSKALIAFRRAEPTVRQPEFLRGKPFRPGGLPDVSWFSASGGPMDWLGDGRSLVCLLAAFPREDLYSPPNRNVLMLFHCGTDARHFTLPVPARGLPWRLLLNTGAECPNDIYPEFNGPPPPSNGIVTVEARSTVVFVASDADAGFVQA
jgi:glycogen operon protein